MFNDDLMTVNVNLSGLPALVIRSKDNLVKITRYFHLGFKSFRRSGEAELLGGSHIRNVFCGGKLYRIAFRNIFVLINKVAAFLSEKLRIPTKVPQRQLPPT